MDQMVTSPHQTAYNYEFETARLRFRRLQPTDAEGLLPIVSRTDVMQWTSGSTVSTLDKARVWIEERALRKDGFHFVIDMKEDHKAGSKYIGTIGCYGRPMIGYLIHPDYAGRGYATEALREIVPRLFDLMPSRSDSELGFDYIEAITDRENAASRRVLEKCGFTLRETKLKAFEQPILGVRDTCIYRIERSA